MGSDHETGASGWRRSISTCLHSRPVELVVILMITAELVMTSSEIGISEKLVCMFGQAGPPLEHHGEHDVAASELEESNTGNHHRRLNGAAHAESQSVAEMTGSVEIPPGYVLCQGPGGPRVEPVMKSFTSWAKVFAIVFAVELMLKIMAGGAKFFSECWHIVDLIAVVVNVVVEFVVHGVAHGGGLAAAEISQLMLIIRLWRLVKFCNLIREGKELLGDDSDSEEGSDAELAA